MANAKPVQGTTPSSRGGGPIDYSGARTGEQGPSNQRPVTLPSGTVTVVVDTPAGPQFPYYQELQGSDRAFADKAMQLGSVQQAIETERGFASDRRDPNAPFNQQALNTGALQAANTAELQRLQQEQARIFAQQNGLGVQNQNYIVGLQNNAGVLAQQNNDLTNRAWQNADIANAADQRALGQYTQALNNATNWDLANYGNLNNAFGQTKILQAGGYGAPVVSQAQFAQADPGAIAAQQQALGQLQGAANGSLNQTSRAAQAYADAGDVANQRNAADKLNAIANGSKDVRVGQADPVAYASALNALDKYTALTNPEVTAQEKFIYEQARLRQEQDDRANRAATMSNLRRRGVAGSGMEITDNALAAQRTSQNRLLSDLGAQANAIARAQNSLAGQAQLSSTLNAQGNAIAMGNADRQAAAQQAAYAAYANLRAQGFSEEYARGQAADIMATANADRQLNAMNASGNLASNMRSQSFNEDFSRKSAADSVAMFNKEQSQISQRWQEQYAAQQQTDAWNRSKDMFDAGNTVGRNYVTDQGNLFTGTTTVNNNTANRNTNAINSVGQLNANTNQGWANVANAGIAANQAQSGTYAQQLAAMTQLGGMGMQNNFNMAQLANQQQQQRAAAEAQRQATKFAQQQFEASKSEGLFGTPLLSQEGILGIKGIPIL